MAISVRTVTAATASTASSTTLTVTPPAGTATGDLMLALLSIANPASGSPPTVTPPSGWTAVGSLTSDPADSNGGTSAQFFWRVRGSSDTATYTFTVSSARSMAAAVMSYLGCDTTAPVLVHSETFEAGSAASTHATQSITPTTANCWTVTGIADRTSGMTHTGSTGVERVDYSAGGATPTANLALFDSNGAIPASAYTQTFTASGSSSNAVMLAVALQTPTGIQRTIAGTISPGSSTRRQAGKRIAASAAPSNTTRKTGMGRTVTGTLTASGVKRGLLATRRLFGRIDFTSTTTHGFPRNVVGSLTPTGVFRTRTTLHNTVGSLTGAGVAVRAFRRTVAGAATAAAAVTRTPGKRPAGSITAAGAPHPITTFFRAMAGALTGVGVTRRGARLRPAGSVTGAGTHKPRAIRKRPAGSIRGVGTALHAAFQRIFGRSGVAIVTLAPKAEAESRFYLRHKATLTIVTPRTETLVATYVSPLNLLPPVSDDNTTPLAPWLRSSSAVILYDDPEMGTAWQMPCATYQYLYLPFTANASTTYTVSFYLKADAGAVSSNGAGFAWEGVGTSRLITALPTTWTRYTVTFTVASTPATRTGNFVMPSNYTLTPSGSGNVYIARPMLQLGSVATPYLGPSPIGDAALTWRNQ